MHFIRKNLTPGKGYSCVFRQQNAASHCRLMHGYDLQFGVTLAAHTLDANGWVFDFGGFKEVEKQLKDAFDHQVVISSEDKELQTFLDMQGRGMCELTILPRVGCEAFATWFAELVQNQLYNLGESERVVLIATTVDEHEGNRAGWINPKFAGMVGIV